MRISFSPQLRDDTLTIIKQGDVLTINDEEFDFSDLPNGGTLPADAIDCEWIIGGVTRVNGGINLTILLPHEPNASENVTFPKPLINPPNGKVKLPENENED